MEGTGHTWYCSGKCSVTYSLMASLAWLRRYCISKLIEAFDTCNSCTISVWLNPLALVSTTLEERLIVYFMVAMVAAGEVVETLESAAIQVLVLSQAIDFDLVKMKWDLSVA
jgi:hypothetical protein